MATVAPQRPNLSGLAATYAAASAGGDKFDPGEHVMAHVKNASAAAVTVTIVTPNTVVGLAVADAGGSVPAGGDRFFGPFPREHFAGSDGLVSVTWSATASVTFAVIAV